MYGSKEVLLPQNRHEQGKENEQVKIREKLRRFFEEDYLDFGWDRKFDFIKEAFASVDTILAYVGCPDDGSGLITALQRERVAIFFEELLHFIKNKRRDAASRQQLEEYVAAWRDAAFSISPNIFNWMDREGQLLTAAAFSRIPETQGNLAQAQVGELVYEFQFLGEDQDRQRFLSRALERATIDQRLDLILFLSTIGADALAQGRWAEDAAASIKKFLSSLGDDEHQSPFVHYAAMNAVQVIENEARRPTRGVLIHQGDRSIGRRAEEVSRNILEENRSLRERITPDKDSYSENVLGRISRDVIASFDQAFIPQSFALVRWEEVRDKKEIVSVHFDLFENFEGNEKLMPKGSKEAIDTAVLLQELHHPAMRQAIEEDMGIKLTELSLREQIQLLSYLASVDYEAARQGFAAIKKHGANAARAFLSCEYGKHLGDAVVKIADGMDSEAAQAVFARYVAIIDMTERTTEELLRDFFIEDKGQKVDQGKINEELLSRAKDIVALFAKRMESEGEVAAEEVMKQLDRFEQDTVLFASMFKTLAKDGKRIEFEDIRDVTFACTSPHDLDEREKTHMIEILDENWRSQKPNVADWVRAGFKKSLDRENERTRVYVLKKAGNIVAFMRFDERDDGSLYAASLNIAPELRGSALGEAMLTKTLDTEAKGRVVHGDFFPEVSAGTMYVESLGWVVTGVEEVVIDDRGTTERRLVMKRDDAVNPRYPSRRMEKDRLMEYTDAPEEKNGIRTHRFVFPLQQEAFVEAVRQATVTGRVMTRYLAEAANKNIRYVVFEPRLVGEAEASAP